MTEKYTVLSIDDDKFIHKVIDKTLNPQYETLFALTGEEGINMTKMHKPDVIITDVEMPGMNGYEVCEKLKSDPATSHIPVIFLSGLDSLQQKLSGFEAGADDYLIKPFDANALCKKIASMTKYAQEQAEIAKKIADAEKTAYMALTGSSDLGLALQLVEKCNSANSLNELAELLLPYVKSRGLDCTLMIMMAGTPVCLTTEGVASPLEADLIELLRAEQDRFHDFGCRTQINFPNISLLIKNMPLKDMTEYGRIKDALPPVLASFETKIKSLNTDAIIRDQNLTLNDSFKEIRESLEGLGKSLHQNSQSSFEIMNKMLSDLNMQLPSMGLEEDQEEFILNSIETAVESVREAADTGENINASFTMVIGQLQTLVDQQNLLLDSSAKIQQEKEINIDKDSRDSGSMDVELF